MTVIAPDTPTTPRRPPRRFGAHDVTTAILLATAEGPDGTAALLAWEDTTVLGHLLEQLEDLGLRDLHVIARPGAGERLSHPRVRVHTSADAGEDLRFVAEIARSARGGLVVSAGEVVTQHEALAGLLINPKVATGALLTTGRVARPFGFRVRSHRGRIVSAASPYHAVHAPTTTSLGVVKVAARDRERLVAAADALTPLAAQPSAAWREELAVKRESWTRALKRIALRERDEEVPEPEELDTLPLADADAEELERRLAVAPDDVASLLLVGLVRDGGPVGVTHLRSLFWARPLSSADVARAAEEVTHHDEDKALLDSAVKSSDGFFTTFFVSSYSRYIARWTARQGFTPNQITVFSMLLAVLASAGFATGERWGLVTGAILIYFAFVFDCVDGQNARYTRTFTKLGAWLDSIFDRSKEYLAFAGLAIGASRMGHDVWVLAGCALGLQTARHAIDFAYPPSVQQAILSAPQPPLEQPDDGAGRPATDEDDAEPERPPVAAVPPTARQRVWRAWRGLNRSRKIIWVKKMIVFPIGERFAVIAITAALWDARVTFKVLLAWGLFAMAYILIGRTLRSLRAHRRAIAPGGAELLLYYREDGPLARAIGAALGRALPVPAAAALVVGLLPAVAVIAARGADAPAGLIAAVVAWFVLWGGMSRGQPLSDPLRWAVPSLLRAGEYGLLVWCGVLAGESSRPAAFALLCALAFRHYDNVYRMRHQGHGPPPWIVAVSGGWDVRLVLAFLLLAAGALPAAFWIWAIALAVALVGESVLSWTRTTRQMDDYDDGDEEAAE
jgi:hypothetical protein